MMGYAFISGLVGIFLGFVVIPIVLGGFDRQTRPRRGVRPIPGMRDSIAKARAYAFEEMYKNYANPFSAHYLTEEDLEDVHIAVRKRLIASEGDQSIFYQQAGYDFYDYIDITLQKGIDEAAEAFLAI